MTTALYGPAGFYSAGPGPAAHFRTSVTASQLLADCLAPWVASLDAELGHPDPFDVVDVGGGDGRLLLQLAGALASEPVSSRLRLTCVEQRGRPSDVPQTVRWEHSTPQDVVGLVLAHELLDNAPVDVVTVDGSGRLRRVLVDAEGDEQLGGDPDAETRAWLERWWPMDDATVGDRAEVGDRRDALWQQLVGSLRQGVALAVDYVHERDERARRQWASGTLTAYRDGRLVPIHLDGSCDVTAHVALDACAAAGRAIGIDDEARLTQRDALLRLGLDAPRPDHALATSQPLQYVRMLQHRGQAHELMDAAGLGGFGWLLQSRGCRVPAPLGKVRVT